MNFVKGMAKLIVLASCLALPSTMSWAQSTATTFTYQGLLTENGSPVTTPCDLRFRLFDSANGGNQIGISQTITNVPMSAGRFTVQLDFGLSAFDNSNRWLDILYRCPAGVGPYIILSPRQPITRSPYAIQTRGVAVDANENVGIGTNAPADELHVAGDNATLRLEDTTTPGGFTLFEDAQPTQLRISKTNISGQVLLDLNPQPGDGTSNALVRFFRQTDTTGIKRVQFLRGNFTTSPSASIGVDGEDSYFQVHGGNVGIGTDNPLADSRLTIDSAGADIGISIISSGTFPAGIALEQDDDTWLIRNVVDSFILTRTTTGGFVHHLTIEDNGRVGIGTIFPANTLHVNGSAGKPGGGSWSNASDIRLKKNIEPLAGSLDRLLQLRGVTFEYIDPDSIHELNGERVGVVAQEVEAVFPDWIDERADGYKTVTFRGFEALTVEALRELRAEKDQQLEAKSDEIALLREENNLLTARLTKLERGFAELAAHFEANHR